MNDALGELPVVLVATRGLVEVEAQVPGSGALRYVSGAEVRAYRRGAVRFALPGDEESQESQTEDAGAGAAEDDALVDASGARWRVTEAALLGPDGRRAERLTGAIAYWFAWRAFHPETEVYEP